MVALAAVLWALLGPLTTELFDEGVDASTIAFWRAAIAGALFVAHGLVTGTLRRPVGREPFVLAGFAVVGVAVFYSSLPRAVDAGGVGLAAILLYSAPLFVALASRLLFGDVLDRRRVVPVVATVVGVGLVALGAGGTVERPGPALFWGLTAGLTYASYYVVGRLLGPGYGPAATYAIAFPLGALLLLPAADPDVGSSRAWLLVAVIGVVSTYLAYLCFATGLRLVDPTRASVVATLEPVVATALGAALYDERLGAVTLLGGLIVVGSAAVSASGTRAGAVDPAAD
ncbi:MAG: EamA family transporter, partial [Actinomycetota bacterium]